MSRQGTSSRECTCTPPFIQSYVAKISGSLLDRVDTHIDIPAVRYQEAAALAKLEQLKWNGDKPEAD